MWWIIPKLIWHCSHAKKNSFFFFFIFWVKDFLCNLYRTKKKKKHYDIHPFTWANIGFIHISKKKKIHILLWKIIVLFLFWKERRNKNYDHLEPINMKSNNFIFINPNFDGTYKWKIYLRFICIIHYIFLKKLYLLVRYLYIIFYFIRLY